MSERKCKECDAKLKPGKSRCPRCYYWNVGQVQSVEEHTVLLSDAAVSVIERIETGLVDRVFGGGICKTSVNLLAGDPGCGKTTLCLQLGDLFLTKFPHREVLYIANEQDPSELKSTAQRLQLQNLGGMRIVKGMGGISFDLGEMLLRYNPCLIVLDSVTKWSGEDPEAAVTICQNLKDYCVKLRSPALVINQVTKGGDHAGLNKMKHAVDMCAMFEVEYLDDESTSPETTVRKLSTDKNRFGPAPEEMFFKMTETGLVELTAEDLEELEKSLDYDEDE